MSPRIGIGDFDTVQIRAVRVLAEQKKDPGNRSGGDGISNLKSDSQSRASPDLESLLVRITGKWWLRQPSGRSG